MKFRLKTITRAATAAAFIAVCAQIFIPSAVPFTLQSFAVQFVYLTFGPRVGALASLIYMTLGAVGLPVFNGFSGGIGALLGPTGGFITGFLLCSVAFVPLNRKKSPSFNSEFLVSLASTTIIYICGTFVYVFVWQRSGFSALPTAITVCVLPFLLPDIIKSLLAVTISRRIRPALNR